MCVRQQILGCGIVMLHITVSKFPTISVYWNKQHLTDALSSMSEQPVNNWPLLLCRTIVLSEEASEI